MTAATFEERAAQAAQQVPQPRIDLVLIAGWWSAAHVCSMWAAETANC